ncbi:MAG: hypothetical protein ACTSPT_03395, partial [Candidatus Heimdallarchaeota archaeon]
MKDVSKEKSGDEKETDETSSKENNQEEIVEEEKEEIKEEVDEEEQDTSNDEEENEEDTDESSFDKDEYIYQKLVKKRNHVYSCIANVLKNYNRKHVLDAFIPEREKLAMKLATILMTKDGITINDHSNLS